MAHYTVFMQRFSGASVKLKCWPGVLVRAILHPNSSVLLRVSPDGKLVLVLGKCCGWPYSSSPFAPQLFVLLPNGVFRRQKITLSHLGAAAAAAVFGFVYDACWAQNDDGSWCVLLHDAMANVVRQWTLLDAQPVIRDVYETRCPKDISNTCCPAGLSAAAGRAALIEHNSECGDKVVWWCSDGVEFIKCQTRFIKSAALSSDGTLVAVVVMNVGKRIGEAWYRVDVHDVASGGFVCTILPASILAPFAPQLWHNANTVVVCSDTRGWLVKAVCRGRADVFKCGVDSTAELVMSIRETDNVGVAAGVDESVVVLGAGRLDLYVTDAMARRLQMSAARVAWLACVFRVPQQPTRVCKQKKMHL